jgi:hypothetical protein
MPYFPIWVKESNLAKKNGFREISIPWASSCKVVFNDLVISPDFE